ncbi:MAG: hypothetical protein COX81_03380 [Candidatus Magasanikbacteria bacterium CG_4_10_14_0_2_um_filter_37_12]|uniref:Uncharacterized protein n=1 Tax=Candidatus Magasanikbacteria bacterium CG_4_10_14_0_2_um_filter_37_12 TaxID=1974637 RepID=A0A2M7V750_9BACT|nr:MAG: hypothetical protein COX81_03380 [Candidatus Magasanikbacteria bacterium CG_4_10_14_0_2_um_filter_37_12]
MKKFSVNKQLILTNIGIFIIIILIMVLIVIPTFKKISTLQKQIKDIHQTMEEDYQKVKQTKHTLSEIKNVEKEIENIQKTFINPGQELAIITELEKLAEKYHITQTLHASATNFKLPDGDGIDYTFSFLNHGTFENHMLFLKDLEQLPYYVNIGGLQWEKRAGNLDIETPLTLKFDGHIYAQIPNKK